MLYLLSESNPRVAFKSLQTVAANGARQDSFVSNLLFHLLWYRIVSMYSQAQLTKASGKLIALAGVVDEITRRIGWKYVWGLWRECLVLNLLWFLDKPAQMRPNRELIPSWSWASVDGAVTHHLMAVAIFWKSMVIDVEILDHGRYAPVLGSVECTILAMTGSLVKFHAVLDERSQYWYITIPTGRYPLRIGRRYTDEFYPGLSGKPIFCLRCLQGWRPLPPQGHKDKYQTEVIGLALELVDEETEYPTFRRLGLFTTQHVSGVALADGWSLEAYEYFEAPEHSQRIFIV